MVDQLPNAPLLRLNQGVGIQCHLIPYDEPEISADEDGKTEVCSGQVRIEKATIFKISKGSVHRVEICEIEIGSRGFNAEQIGARKVGLAQVSGTHIGAAQIGSGQGGLLQRGAHQAGSKEIRLLQLAG